MQPVLAHPNNPNSVLGSNIPYMQKQDQYFNIQGRIVNGFQQGNQVQPPQKPPQNFNVNQVLPPQKQAVNFHPQPNGQQGQFSLNQFEQPPPRHHQASNQQFSPNHPPQQQSQQQNNFNFQRENQGPLFRIIPHQPPLNQRGQFPPTHQFQAPNKQPVRFNNGNQQPAKLQFVQQQTNFQSHQNQQPRPVHIPLHNVQQQQQHQLQPQQQNTFQNVRFNQPFTAFQQQQQQQSQQPPRPQEPRPQSEQTRPSSNQQFAHQTPFVTHQQLPNNQPPRTFQQQTTSVHQGLVQQQAPQNLAQQNPNLREHMQHLQYILPAGGEIVPSLSQYEHHITETIQHPENHRQQQQQAQFRQQPTAPPIIHKEVTSSSNIGPLAHTIGHLPGPSYTTESSLVQNFQRYQNQQQGQIQHHNHNQLHQQQQQLQLGAPQIFPPETTQIIQQPAINVSSFFLNKF